MRILKISRKDNFFEVAAECLDDLWHLERVIEKGDVVSGKTERKIKGKEEGEKARKEVMRLDIEVEKVEFHESVAVLRLMGLIVGGSPEELVDLKAHHTIEVRVGGRVKVQKKGLKDYQVKRLEKAQKASGREKLVAVVLDDEIADVALVKEFGIEHKAKIAAGKGGKQYAGEDSTAKFFDEILEKVKALGGEKVIFAGPGFSKQNLQKYIGEKRLKLKAYYESTNSVGRVGLSELVRAGIIDKVVKELQLSEETKAVEGVLAEVGKDSGLGAYGKDEVKGAVEAGAVEVLVICDSTLLEDREWAEMVLEAVEKAQGEVHIVSDKHDAGQKLKGIGGVAARLRYRLG